MADTAHKTAFEVVEHTDAPHILEAKLDRLAALFASARNAISWTGAGISTNSGIPDFRGPTGKWTLVAQGKKPLAGRAGGTLSAVPTLTHRSIVELLRCGKLKFLISSNTDGLHRRSGVPADKIAELHGNSNRVRCEGCGAIAFVDSRARTAAKVHDHETAWACYMGDACVAAQKAKLAAQPRKGKAAADDGAVVTAPLAPGRMIDTIINFGEYLESPVQGAANAASAEADLLLVLGTSLRVVTCDALKCIAENGGSLVVVNKQITPYDDRCKLRIFADCDEVMRGLMKRLGLTVSPVTLTRTVLMRPFAPSSGGQREAALGMAGLDTNSAGGADVPFAFVKTAELVLFRPSDLTTLVPVGEPAKVAADAPWAGLALPWSAVPQALAKVNAADAAVAAAATDRDSGDEWHVGIEWGSAGHRKEPPCLVPLGPAATTAMPTDLRFVCTLAFSDNGEPVASGWAVAKAQCSTASSAKNCACM